MIACIVGGNTIMREWLIERLGERSTIQALVVAGCTVGGIVLTPEQTDAVLTISTVAGIGIGVWTKERKG